MSALATTPWRRLLCPLLAVAIVGGCSTMEVRPTTVAKTEALKQGPQAQPFRSITGFSGALRCMDKLLLDYGVRDVNMLVEDIFDQTKKVNAGTRDMLISAVSDMTRRSRAIRVNAFGRDATNVISYLASAQRQGAYELVPQYDIKGSITQFDENVVRGQKDLGIGWKPYLNLGASKDATTSILGLDLSVLTTDDLSVLAGVTSRNAVVILKQGSGLDSDAAYHKFGLSFSMSLNQAEGQSQALRGLVELASIELMGRLTKTPYWTCLGADPAGSEEVRLEISDWYHAMAASRAELIGWFQQQLRRRGFYDGPVDGAFNPALDEAIANYRVALGLSRADLLDEAFFTAYLQADHTKIAAPPQPAVARPVTAAPVPVATPPVLELRTTARRTTFAAGEAYAITLRSDRDAYVYCYLFDEAGRLARFWPNRFAKDAFVPAGGLLTVPGTMRFRFVMNRRNAEETLSCFAAPRDPGARLSAALLGTDFEPIAGASLAQLRAAFADAAGPALAQETLRVQAR